MAPPELIAARYLGRDLDVELGVPLLVYRLC
jgi:hypothetical protein